MASLLRSVAGFGKRLADALASLDHPVRLRLAGGVLAVVAVVDPLQELGKFPGLRIREDHLDLNTLHR